MGSPPVIPNGKGAMLLWTQRGQAGSLSCMWWCASAGFLILGSCTTSHPHSRLPDHASNVLLPINKQIGSAVIIFVSNGPVFGCVCFCGDQQHATHPAAGKMYTCLMITHMYDENNDLDMFNVFFNEPVLCPVGVGAG